MKIIRKRGKDDYNTSDSEAAEDAYYAGSVKGSFDDAPEQVQDMDYSGSGISDDVRDNRPQRREANYELKVLKPTDYTDGPMIADELANGNTVLLTIEGMEPESIRRLIDFLLGALHVLGGELKRVSGTTLVLAPQNTSVTGFEAFGESTDDAADEEDTEYADETLGYDNDNDNDDDNN